MIGVVMNRLVGMDFKINLVGKSALCAVYRIRVTLSALILHGIHVTKRYSES